MKSERFPSFHWQSTYFLPICFKKCS